MPRTAHAAALEAPDAPAGAPEPTVEQRLLSLRELGHTLRTPLSAIIGFAEILGQEQRGPEDPHREYAEIIRQSGLQMLELVNRTLQGAADDIRRSAE
ncbi:MAG: hypothetical protein M3M95_07405 [Pseudomonadota bacterium]|nr:hypothetical protein [Pseudomonadota bacterium]